MDLSSVMIYALQRNKFYYNIMTSNPKAIKEFPIITKDDVKNGFGNIVNYDLLSSSYIIAKTSGSSGLPLDIYWNEFDYLNSLKEIWKCRMNCGVTPHDRFVSAHILFEVNNLIYKNKIIINKNNMSISKVFMNDESLMSYYESIMEFDPKWMLLPPSFLYGFLLFLEKNNLRFSKHVKLIELTGEACSREVYDYFIKCYPSINWKILYGMQEFNAIAYGDINGLNVLTDNTYVEIIDNGKEMVNNSLEGDIVVTGLKNKAMPLVRYKSGDRGFFDSNHKLHITKSRSNDSFIYGNKKYDGSLFWSIITELNVNTSNVVRQFQVVLDTNGFTFNLVLNDVFFNETEIYSFIKHKLNDNYLIDIQISINIVESINPIENSEKIKYFYNRII